MIGIKIQNPVWQKALLHLLEKNAELWQKGHKYQAVLVQLSDKEIKDFQQKENAPLIGLGHSNLPYQIQTPFKLERLHAILASLPTTYENRFFIWDMAHRHLLNKKTKKQILLTEKENELILFLKNQPHQMATREELLKNVWQYTLDTETHTVESTLYTLRQKMKNFADDFIQSTETGYRLV